MTRVGRAGRPDPSAPGYRIVYGPLSPILTVGVDAAARIRRQQRSGRMSPRPNTTGIGR
jgi:hypothetical protein